MSILTSNIELFVPNPMAIMVRAKVLGSRFKPVGGGQEAGIATLKVLELYRGPAPAVGEVFEIEGTRSMDAERRIMDSTNSWNSLPFALNDEILLALHAGSKPQVYIALAAVSTHIQGIDLKEAIAIEATPAAHRLARLRLAVQSGSYMLQSYAFGALHDPAVATREQGALALVHGFEASSDATARNILLGEMGNRTYSDMALGPDAANRAILSTLLKAILHESNGERRTELVNRLAAKLGTTLSPESSKDRELRAKFVAAISDPPKAQVAGMLQAAAAANPSEIRLKRLVDAWSH